MRALRAFLRRLAGLSARERRDRELAEELECHLAMQVEEGIRAGMTPEAARRDALLRSGGLDLAKEEYRDRRGLPSVETALRDFRHTLRSLGREPAFVAAAVLSLALGIGANTAIFTLLDRITLRMLPVRNPEQLVMVWTSGPHLGFKQGSRTTSYPMYQDFQQRAQAFSYVFCRYSTPVSLGLADRNERVMSELVSGNYFQALGVGAALGRVFSPEQDDREYLGHPAVVLSYPYWVARFGADPGAIGRRILVNNYPMTIVGVSAAGFTGIDPVRSPQIRIPIQMKPLTTPGSGNMGNRRRQWVHVFARLKPGGTADAARASLQPLLSQIVRAELEMADLRDTPRQDRDRFLARQALVEPAGNGYTELRSRYEGALVVLMGMVGLVLAIACFNVASLLIARAAARQKELAIRLAIGASRARLLRQLLMESAVLALAGGALGLLMAVALVRGLLRFLPSDGMLATLRAEPDWRILGFNAALAFGTILVFGLAPAWQALRVGLWDSLKQAAGAVAGSRGSLRLRRTLVAAQVAFSFLLVSGSVLLVQTLFNLRQIDSGFRDLSSLVTFQADPARSGYSLPRLLAFYSELQRRIRTLPGVRQVAFAWVPVLDSRHSGWDVAVEGYTGGGNPMASVNGTSPGYWRTMGIPLAEGRDFDERDVHGRPQVAIVNRKFAQHYFGGRSPVGRRFGLDTGQKRVNYDIEIVGLVEDSLYDGPRQGVRRQVFFPFAQLNQPLGGTFYVRTVAGTGSLFAALERRVRELDPDIPVYEMKTMDAQLDQTLGSERLSAALSAAFGCLAVVLAAVGIYGVVALTVVRRTREIGLRMAVGAGRGTVLWMVMREALGMLAAGLAVGVPCAYWAGRYLASQLFGVTHTGCFVAAVATLVLAAVTAAAGILPARRASLIDPIQALRHE